MPAGGIHLCVGVEVNKKLGKEISLDYLLGNVAPDSWRNTNSNRKVSHFIKIINNKYTYDYDYFYNKYKDYMNNNYVLGYLIHLITDSYWYGNNFITSHISEKENIELKKACSRLISIYKIPRLIIYNNIDNKIEELSLDGLSDTVNYLNSVNYLEDKDTKFDIDTLLSSIDKTSNYVILELDRLKKVYGGNYE